MEEQEEEESERCWEKREGGEEGSFGSNLCPHWTRSKTHTVMFYPHVSIVLLCIIKVELVCLFIY